MSYDVSSNQPINFNPSTVVDEVLQNVAVILATPLGTAPMNRALGVSGAALDRPIPSAIALQQADIVEAIQRWEPRATVESVRYDGDADAGTLRPIVRININA